MIKKAIECGGVVSLVALAACGGTFQDIGDGGSGSGGTSNMTQSVAGDTAEGGNEATAGSRAAGGSGTSSSQGSDGRAGAPWAPGTCDPPCSEGYGCYELANDPAGFCAPLCDSDEQGQTPAADLSCSNSVRGGAGTCVFSLSFGWPIPGGSELPFLTSRVVTGLCSNSCDPIEQDCPDGYKCDITATYSAVSQEGMYACMPNKVPSALGESCDGTGDGQCDAGLSCSIPDAATSIYDATCEALCDSRDPDACPTGQTCTETVVTMQDSDANIGVCL